MSDDIFGKIATDNPTGTIIGSLIVAIPVVWILIKKAITLNKIVDGQIAAADTRISSENASSDIYKRLMEEVKRLGTRVAELEREKNMLHEENLDLKIKLTELDITIKRMQEEINGIGRRRDICG